MYCEKCGREIPDNAKFCENCGNQVKKTKHRKIENKSMFLSLFLSIFLLGLGISYAGDKKKGICFFVVILLLQRLRKFPVLPAIAAVIWLYAIYETYREVKRANGEENPDFKKDLNDFINSESFLPLAVYAVILIIFYFIIRILFY